MKKLLLYYCLVILEDLLDYYMSSCGLLGWCEGGTDTQTIRITKEKS